MKFTGNSENFVESLRDPDTKVKAIKMTPEMKERLGRICDEMIDELRKRTGSPMEAHIVLHFLIETLDEAFGITGLLVATDKDRA